MIKTSKTHKNALETAKLTAFSALSLLLSDETRLTNFLSLSGLDPSDLRELSSETSFLAGVLDYFLSDEKYLLEFCKGEGIKPETVMRAAHDLGGGVWESESA